jgi:type I restriction enzyme, S subunit
MHCDWPIVDLGSHVDLLTGFPFKSAEYVQDKAQPRLVRGDNVVQGAFRWDGVQRWPADKTESLHRYWLQLDDVVLAMDRPWIEAGLKFASIGKSDLPALLVQRVARLRGQNGLSTRFLKWVIASPAFTDYVLGVQTGTAVPHISGDQIKRFRFALPSRFEQEAIASILGALDHKIELNRRMNQTLEEIARTIFTSWFVRFDPVRAKAEGRQPGGMDAETAALFPDAFVDSALGPIPAGWDSGDISSLISIRRETINPGGFANEIFDLYSLPAFDTGKIPEQISGETIKSVKAIVGHDSVLLSKLNPHIPRIWLPSLDGVRRAICSTEFLVIDTIALDQRGFVYSLLASEWFMQRFGSLVTGTTGSHQRVRPEALLTIKTATASAQVRRVFSLLVDPLLGKIATNRSESITLASLRDALLPKFLSGELRIQEAEARAGQAA